MLEMSRMCQLWRRRANVRRSRQKTFASLFIEGKTPFDRVGVVPPPVRHDRTGSAQKDEDKQQVEVETGIEGGTTDVSPHVPKLSPVSVQPKVPDRSNNESGEWTSTQVAIEGGRTREKDGCVPEIEASPRESLVQEPNDHGRSCTQNHTSKACRRWI